MKGEARQELTYLKAQLLAKIQTAVTPEAVTDLRFYVRAGASSPKGEPGAEPSTERDPADDPAERPLAPEVSAALDAFENELDQIQDPDSPVGMDAVYVHAVILDRLAQIEARLDALDGKATDGED